MIVLLGNGGGRALRVLMQQRPEIGLMLSPTGWRNPHVTCCYACDCDVYAAWTKAQDTSLPETERKVWREYWNGGGLGERRWLKMLDKIPADHPPLFVLLPDVVADWKRTLDRACRYRDELWQRNLPIGVALQNGCVFEEALRICPQFVFIGGTTEWKWAHAEQIVDFFHWRDVRVHVGRSSGYRRIRHCMRIGADSTDGTGWVRNPGRELPKLLQELDGTHPQLRFAF